MQLHRTGGWDRRWKGSSIVDEALSSARPAWGFPERKTRVYISQDNTGISANSTNGDFGQGYRHDIDRHQWARPGDMCYIILRRKCYRFRSFKLLALHLYP